MSESKILWHKYPDEKPQRNDDYLVTIKTSRKLYISKDCYDINEGEFEFEFMTEIIIAWAEMPEPYNPEAKDE